MQLDLAALRRLIELRQIRKAWHLSHLIPVSKDVRQILGLTADAFEDCGLQRGIAFEPLEKICAKVLAELTPSTPPDNQHS